MKDELHLLENTPGIILSIFPCEELWETINRAHYAANNGYKWFSFEKQKEYLIYENEINLTEEENSEDNIKKKKVLKKRKAKTK